MKYIQWIVRLAVNDVRLIFRDSMLIMLSCFIVVIALFARYMLPIIDSSLQASSNIEFSYTFPMWFAFLALWQAALIPGIIIGFLVLDEKEDNTLIALCVTPLPLDFYLIYRVSLAAIISFIFSLLMAALTGLLEIVFWKYVLTAMTCSLLAPIVVLLLASFATDKVQGLALTKFGGVAGLTIMGGWFVSEPYQWLFGIFPPFLTSKAYWMFIEHRAQAWWILLLAVFLQAWVLRVLIARFRAALLST